MLFLYVQYLFYQLFMGSGKTDDDRKNYAGNYR